MSEKRRITRRMKITNDYHQHIGTVDAVEGSAIRLIKSDAMDGKPRFLRLKDVERIENNCIFLKKTAIIPTGLGYHRQTSAQT